MSCKLNKANYAEMAAPGQFQATEIHTVDQCIRQSELDRKEAERNPGIVLSEPITDWERQFALRRQEDRIMFDRGSSTRRPGDGIDESL